MSEHEGREFRHGLAEDVDAWLAGRPTRRNFVRRFGQMTGMLAASGAFRMAGSNDAYGEDVMALPDQGTPLGKAITAAIRASTEGPPDGSAYRAVQAAGMHRGASLNMTAAKGPQALEPRNFSGPAWGQLTGIASTVSELPYADLYSKAILEHIALSGAFDILDIEPSWTPSLAEGSVIAPLDDYIGMFMNKADLEDYHPLYRTLPRYKGKIWGLFDDGDVLALYYRTDIFNDAGLKLAYAGKLQKELTVPTTWEEYVRIAQFITDERAPQIYGAAHFRKAGSPGNQFDFLQQYRANRGVLFDENMRAQLASPAGIRTLENMLAANAASIPGNDELDAVSVWAAWLQGKVAMIYSWPPTGRMTANIRRLRKRSNSCRILPSPGRSATPSFREIPGTPSVSTKHCPRTRRIPRRHFFSCNG